VIASVYRPTLSSAVVSLLPPPIPWGTGSFSVLSAAVRLLVDDSVSLIVYRPTGSGLTDCAVTFIGYTTPLAQ
jgi:hypothetical protein